MNTRNSAADYQVDYSKYLDLDSVSPAYTDGISVIPRNIVTERRKKIENPLPADKAEGVDKRHAILCFDPKSVSFSLKDLQSTNGTYLNEQKLQSEHPRRLNNMDLLRFGYDSKVFQIRTASGNPDHSRSHGGNLFNLHQASEMDSRYDAPVGLSSQQVAQGVLGKPRAMNGSRVSSPSYAADRDSGRGSTSVPSSPAKEMSPVSNSLFSNRGSPVPHHSQQNSTTASSRGTGSLKSPVSVDRLTSLGDLDEINPLTIVEDDRIRKDSLEDEKEDNSKSSERQSWTANRKDWELLRVEPDISVPNEVFEESAQHSTANNSQFEPESFGTGTMARSRSLSGDGGRSRTQLSSLYGTPHWWPDEEDFSSKKNHNLSYYSSNPNRRRWSSGIDCCEDEAKNTRYRGTTPESESGDSDSLRTKKLSPMAFTVDFGGADANKCFGIADSISKFAPRHRKNLSLTKIEDIIGRGKDVPERQADSNSIVHSKLVKRFNPGTSKSVSKGSISDNISRVLKENEVIKDKVPYRKTLSDKQSMLSKPKASVSPTQSARSDGIIQRKDFCNNNVDSEFLKLETEDDSKERSYNVSPDTEDIKSETGTYTIDDSPEDVIEARQNIGAVFGAVNEPKKASPEESDSETRNGTSTSELEWVREWAESAAKLQQTPATNPELERTVANTRPKSVPNAQHQHFRIRSVPLAREASVLSDSGYALGYASDSSNEGGADFKRAVKYNKALAIRSRVLGYDSDGCTNTKNRQTVTPVRGISPRPNPSMLSRPPLPSSSSLFSRNDGGRFSLRASNKSRSPVNQMPLPSRSTAGPGPSGSRFNQPTKPSSANKSEIASRKQPTQDVAPVSRKPNFGSVGNRSNSTLTAKEVELANWRRRKNYDPMKAAAQAKKKETHLVNREVYSGTESAKEDVVEKQINHNSPVRTKAAYFHRSSVNSGNSYEDVPGMVDEMESSHSNSPTHNGMSRSMHEDSLYCGVPHSSNANPRSKNKLEALDNLVIATIHSLSIKVRTSSRKLLEKLQAQHSDDENGELIKEMVSQLRDLEAMSTAASPTKSPSRELSGTLKNLKKLEQVILVLDRVICDDEGDM